MDTTKLSKVQQELASIRNFCDEHDYMTYEELSDRVEVRVNALRDYAERHKIPMVISLQDIVSEFVEPETDDSYYEEDSSSYYEEESSSYYEDDDDDEIEPPSSWDVE